MERVAKAVLPKAARPGTSNGTSSPQPGTSKGKTPKKTKKPRTPKIYAGDSKTDTG